MWEAIKRKMSSKVLVFLTALTFLVWLAVFSFPDNRLKLTFCNVGQGDAILLSKGLEQMLIDGGPNEKVLDCLAKNLPFFDKTIEIVALTHPEADHLTGLVSVLDKYKVNYFFLGPEKSDSAVYEALGKRLKNRPGLTVINPYRGERIKLGEVELETLWPEREWVVERLEGQSLPTGAVLGASTTHKELNDFSLVFLLKYRDFRTLLTGDGGVAIQPEILAAGKLTKVNLLKVPHHGSKNGLSEEFLATVRPKEAVISVGKNSYGHPTKEVLDLLKKYGVKIRRTDLEGEIHYSIK